MSRLIADAPGLSQQSLKLWRAAAGYRLLADSIAARAAAAVAAPESAVRS